MDFAHVIVLVLYCILGIGCRSNTNTGPGSITCSVIPEVVSLHVSLDEEGSRRKQERGRVLIDENARCDGRQSQTSEGLCMARAILGCGLCMVVRGASRSMRRVIRGCSVRGNVLIW